MVRGLIAILLLPAVLTAQTPPHSGWNPPGAAAAKSLADSTAASAADWLTVAEKTNYVDTGLYQETLEFYRKLAKASPWVKVQTIGKTPQGRDLLLITVAKVSAPDPRKITVLIQNGIHSGEIGGKDASAMLIRDIVLNKRYAPLLDHLVLLFIPVFNVDGHEDRSPYNRINQNGPKETGLRATEQRLNLNRDYVKADAPEMRAWLKVWRDWSPDFLIDNHVTDGEDHQYDLTIAMPTGQDTAAPVADWTGKGFLPDLDKRMTAGGHLMAPYGGMRGDGYRGMIFEPRYSNGYGGIRNRPSLLVETHSLKTYKVQVWSHYDVMLHTFQILAEDAKLKSAIRAADAAKISGTAMFLAGRIGSTGAPFVFHGVASHTEKSTLSGGDYTVYENKPVDIPTKIFNDIETTAETVVPTAYVVPREWTALVALLDVHGVKYTRIAQEQNREAEVYQLNEPKWDAQPFEGRLRLSTKPQLSTAMRTLHVGDYLIPTDQPAGRAAVNILEPMAPDSALQWGMLDANVGRGEGFGAATYVTEPLMQEWAAKSPQLQAEFEAQLKADQKFAANPRARIAWWLERSPYARPQNVYPVFRLR